MIFIIDEKKKRYLIIGLTNTIFGYFIGILNYILFYKIIGIFFLSVLNNIVSITFSFLTYKYFVFKTNNNYILKEYFKSDLNDNSFHIYHGKTKSSARVIPIHPLLK